METGSMPNWVHPDKLDEIAASGGRGGRSTQASAEEVADVLKNVLGRRRPWGIPRNPRRRDIMLAVICLEMRRRHAYTEVALNEILKARLETMNATVDHVTCRRLLVELGFLRRDRAGARYLLDYSRLASTLSADAAISAAVILQEAE